MSLVWSLDRVTQVVMDGLFHPFHFVEKQYSKTRSEELQGLTSVYTQGRTIFYYSHGICFRGLLIENNCFKMEWVLLLILYGFKSSENNMDQMPSRLSVRPQVSVIKTGTYEGIGQRLIGFCV